MPSGETSTAPSAPKIDLNAGFDYGAIIVGAGMSGLYALHRLRGLGVSARVYEQLSGLAGTWLCNAYPGCRFDSESYSYGYSWDPDMLKEWNWSQRFAPQPETLRYLQTIAEKHDLVKDMQFNSRVARATYLPQRAGWEVEIEGGEVKTCRFLVSAVGVLSAPVWPTIEGREDFKRENYHTARWPQTPVSFEGKRVAVIGTGASGVQTIQEVAKTCFSLTVFQRTPNWVAPLHNGPIEADEMEKIKGSYADIFKRCNETWMCFLREQSERRGDPNTQLMTLACCSPADHPDPRSMLSVSDEEREAFFEKQYSSPGFGMWQGNFRDAFVDPRANALVSEFVARKIRERVHDPVVAEKLIPKNHGFGTRRVPLETKYLEVYNQPNVKLVDLTETPIVRITETGIQTTDQHREFDILIYATGFLAVTGSFDRIDIRGPHGTLAEDWANGPRTLLGMMVDGSPNMLMVIGPLCALGNIPRSIEFCVEWIADLVAYMQANGHTVVEARKEAVDTWLEHVKKVGEGLLSSQVDSWMTGVNRNVGKGERSVVRYGGSAVAYRERATGVARGGYQECVFG